MSRLLRIVGISLASLIGLLVVSVATVYAVTSRGVAKKVASPAHGFVAPTDSASIARGAHVLRVLAKCVDCHGQDMGGGMMIDDAAFARMAAPNLTTGRGGVLATYDDAALEAAIRHGVGVDGRRLMIMPSNEYQFLSDEDLGAIIAYLRSLPAVDRSFAPPALGPIARILTITGALPLFPYEAVTHGAEVVAAVPVDTTIAYGEYIGAVGCSGCHGQGYGGGPIPGTPPDWPPPANITMTGIGHYTFADFQKALTDGVRPDGSAINPFMPFAATKQMTEVEMKAVWNYLRSIPPREYGTR